MKKSPNQIRIELKEIASAHLQVNSFHWGDLIDATKLDAIDYPLVNCYYPSGSFQDNTSTLQFVIEIGDKLYKDSSNLNDIESDTLQMIRDFFNVINKSTRWKKIGKVQNATFSKFKWSTGDEIAGHRITINFILRDVSGVCDLPMIDYDFDQDIPAGGCPDARVINSNLTFDEAVSAGSVLELSDITYDIKNSESTTIISGSEVAQVNVNKVLPDIDFTDSDGTTTQEPSGKNLVCTPSVPAGASAMPIDDITGGNPEARPFFTLPIVSAVQQLNHFGSKWRLTGHTGGYYDRDTTTYRDVLDIATTRALAYPDDLICDWSTLNYDGNFLMIVNDSEFIIDTLAGGQAAASATTKGGFSTFRVGTIKQGVQLQKTDDNLSLCYEELYNVAYGFPMHTSTISFGTTGAQLSTYYSNVTDSNTLATMRCFIVRNTNISEL